ncbi:MAG: YsnF/AvaK domain-containing protein [Terriglobales bacterium]|jgi:uncharacterized protein (TIGR02271 family)
MSPNTTTNIGADQLIAFFRDREDAFHAIDELRNQGFDNNEIGLAFQDEGGGRQTSGARSEGDSGKSTWQKIKDFFTGSDEEDENDMAYSSGEMGDDSYRHFNFSDEQWQYYRSGIGQGGAVVTVRSSANRLQQARTILGRYNADFRNSGFDRSEFAFSGTGDNFENQRLQLRGEMLRTYKERIGTGEVRLRKEVVSENRNINVPVSREEVVIERVGADQASPASGNISDIGEGQEIRIPVSEERVRVEKQPVVTGEVRVGKRAVQDTQNVNETVRREEVRVEREGDVNVADDVAPTTKRKKPAA